MINRLVLLLALLVSAPLLSCAQEVPLVPSETPSIPAPEGPATTNTLVVLYPPVLDHVPAERGAEFDKLARESLKRSGIDVIDAVNPPAEPEHAIDGCLGDALRRHASGWVVLHLRDSGDWRADRATIQVWNRHMQAIEVGAGGMASNDTRTTFSLGLEVLRARLAEPNSFRAHLDAGMSEWTPLTLRDKATSDPMDLKLLSARRAMLVRRLAEEGYLTERDGWSVQVATMERTVALGKQGLGLADFEEWFAKTGKRPPTSWDPDAPLLARLYRFETMLSSMIALRSPKQAPDETRALLAAHRAILARMDARDDSGAAALLKDAGPRAQAAQDGLNAMWRKRADEEAKARKSAAAPAK